MTEAQAEVTVAWVSIRRMLGSVADWGMFLLFRPADASRVPGDEVVAAVEAAMIAANEAVPPRMFAGAAALRAVAGVAVPVFWDGHDGQVIRSRLNAFADHLRQAGLAGAVGTSRAIRT